jgi:hypothetical protein
MPNNGWICLHRDIQAHWLFNFAEPDKFMAWCDLLMSANHEDKKFMVKGRVIECKRGQVAMSQTTLQKRWKMSQNKLKRFLVLLKNEGMIDFETNELTTIITICNYSKFQDIERADGRPLERADERGTDDQTDDKQQCKQLKQLNNNKKYSCADPSQGSTPQQPETDFSSCLGIDGLATTETTIPASPMVIELPLNKKGEYHVVTQADVDELSSIYPAVDVMQQFRGMLGWLNANPAKRKTKGGIKNFINTWLAKDQNKGGALRGIQAPQAQTIDGNRKYKVLN